MLVFDPFSSRLGEGRPALNGPDVLLDLEPSAVLVAKDKKTTNIIDSHDASPWSCRRRLSCNLDGGDEARGLRLAAWGHKARTSWPRWAKDLTQALRASSSVPLSSAPNAAIAHPGPLSPVREWLPC